MVLGRRLPFNKLTATGENNTKSRVNPSKKIDILDSARVEGQNFVSECYTYLRVTRVDVSRFE